MSTSNPIGGGPWVDLVRALGVPSNALPFDADPQNQTMAPVLDEGPLWARGATGYSYPHDGGGSNQLMITIGDDTEGYRNVPLIVPGQDDLAGILAGKPATREQARRAATWGKTAGVGNFRTLADALDYEKRYHDELEKLYR